MKEDGKLILPSDFTLGRQMPSQHHLDIDFKAADGSTYVLARNTTFITTDITSASTVDTLREAEAFEVTIKQRISRSSFSEFQSKLEMGHRKGEVRGEQTSTHARTHARTVLREYSCHLLNLRGYIITLK